MVCVISGEEEKAVNWEKGVGLVGFRAGVCQGSSLAHLNLQR